MSVQPKKLNAVGAFMEGRNLVGRVPGLRAAIWKSFFINLFLFFALLAGIFYAGMEYLLDPMEAGLKDWLPGWLDWTAVTLRFALTLLLFLLSLFLAIFLPLNLMFLYYEKLVDKVLDFMGTPRQDHPIPTPLPHTILVGMREVLILLMLVFIGFFPIIGAPLVFVLSSHVMGRATFEPYIAVMKNRGYDLDIPEKKFGLTTIGIGALEAGLPFYFPVLGLFLIPWCVLHLVIGVAWVYESERRKSSCHSLQQEH